jgi:membrane protease subunit HflC
VKRLITILVVIAVVLIVFFAVGPFFIVEEGEQAVVLRFGEIIRTVEEPGLKLKTPALDEVRIYPEKILPWDGQATRIPTSEEQFIWVDTTARWRIADPSQFYASLTTLDSAYERLNDVLETEVRTVITQNALHEAVRSSNIINEQEPEAEVQETAEQQLDEERVQELAELIRTDRQQQTVEAGRDELMNQVFESASQITPQFGIELVDVVFRQIRYAEGLTETVYDRMVSERNRIAQAYRSFGQGERERILGELEREREQIISEARRQAEEIRGEADARAAQIYAEAYGENESFFEFWRSVQSYEQTLPNLSKVLTTDMNYFQFLYDQDGQ